MREFVDIHTHAPQNDVKSVANWRIGIEPMPPSEVLVSAGIHPWDAQALYPTLSTLLLQLENSDCVAIGEVGLDKACGVDWSIQTEVFERQLDIAQRRQLPIIVHCVRATAECLAILGKYSLQAVVFHGFIGSPEQAREILSRGYYLSFGFGCIASPKTLRALCVVPLDRLLLETDTSQRPIEELYEFVAMRKGSDIELLKESINTNFKTIFQ